MGFHQANCAIKILWVIEYKILKMVIDSLVSLLIFQSYVSLPEGTKGHLPKLTTELWVNKKIKQEFLSWMISQPPAEVLVVFSPIFIFGLKKQPSIYESP